MASLDKGRIKRAVEFIPYNASFGMDGSGGTPVSSEAGAPVEKELSTTGHTGVFMDDAGDMVNCSIPVPRDLNPLHPIGIRVVYGTGSATAADSVEWIVLYDVLTEGTALAIGSTVLDTVIGAETISGVTDALEFSGRGVINGGAVSRTVNENNVSFFSFLVECQALTVITEDVIYFGLQMDYVPKRSQGPERTQNPGLTDE